MNRLFLLLFLFLPVCGQAQNEFSITRLIETDTISAYSIVDNVKFMYVRKPKETMQIFANGISIDTTGINFVASQYGRLLAYNNKVYFNTLYNYDEKKYPKEKKLEYSLIDGNVKTFNWAFNYGLQMIPYKIDDQHAKIFRFNPETGEQSLFADFWDLVKKTTFDDGTAISDEGFEQIFFLDSKTAIVTLCYEEGWHGDHYCDKTRHFLIKNNTKTDISQKFIPQFTYPERLKHHISFINFITEDNKYIKENCEITASNVKTEEILDKNISRIFDIQLNFIGEVLPMSDRNYAIDGMNIQKGKIKNYFLRTQTDLTDSTKTKIWGTYPHKYVLIPYRFNPVLEIAMYKAYHNNLLTNNDIQGLQKYELAILRNLIFAKYNYAFSSEFYQAYFNLYEFYGNDKSRKSRVKNVDNLLTEADKANIKLAKDVEAGL